MDLDHDACYRIFLSRDRRFDGRVFVGVRTTGIYCRPICPAPPPRQRNVSFYGSAAAAQEAGYRPCLRCRPEVSPDFAAWHGSSAMVVRALRLIQTGALDHQTADDFAARLGVGARQLRRLFLKHLGAPPTAFAQTRRVHMAKQLIMDTALPMTDVAFASGFQSVRRFNEAFKTMFGRAPAALRHKSPKCEAHGGTLNLQLSFALPYDWTEMLRTLAARAIPGVERVDAGRYRRTLRVGDTQGTVQVERAHEDRLRITLQCAKLAALPELTARLRTVFDLAADPNVLNQHLGVDSAHRDHWLAKPGLRVAGHWDTLELVVRAIFGERLVQPASRSLLGAFIAEFGELSSQPADGLTHLFPTPERLRNGLHGATSLTAEQARAVASYVGASIGQRTPLSSLAPVGEIADWLARLDGFDHDAAVAIATRLAEPTDDVSGLGPSLVARLGPFRPWRAYAALNMLAGEPDDVGNHHTLATQPMRTC